MASITERARKGGRKAYLVQIIRRRLDNYRDSRTFDNRKDAEAWAKKREAEIDLAVAEGRDIRGPQPGKETLGDAIDRYILEQVHMGKTKAQCLRTIRLEYSIAEKACDRITSATIADFARELSSRPTINSPATVNNYLSHLASVFNHANSLWSYPLDSTAMSKAISSCKHIGLISRSRSRDRRPTLDELDKLLTLFEASSRRDARIVPMHLITMFAIFSARRQDEITRITWDDLDIPSKRILVRKMKHPGMRGGIDTPCELPDPCIALISKMPKTHNRIFPFNTDVLSRRFTDACKLLQIHDLRFHDLRHEAASRLAEMGLTIPLLASVTGHKSWQSLQRYTHVRQQGDKYQEWAWLKRAMREDGAAYSPL